MGVRRDLGRLRGCLIVILVVPLVNSHVRFVCPRPRSPRTDLTADQLNGACGLGKPDSQTDEDVTVVSPGPLTVRFEETHFHTDSPFHISLHSYDNDTHWCSLLNHIPHNNAASVDSPGCKDSDYPIGHCTKSTYYVTVNIPDVSCELCYLKLSFITLDKVPMSRLPCQEPNGTCATYVSCANIKIQGGSSSSSGQSRGLETCVNYSDNLLGKWPYTQQQVFKATLSSIVEADFTFDYYDMSLNYHIPTKAIGKVLSIKLYKKNDEKTPVLRQSVSVEDRTDDCVIGKWTNPSISLPLLIAGNYQVEIITTKETFRSSLKYLRDLYQPGVYVPHRAPYSKQGWLNGPEFVGPGATYSQGIEPAWECAPQPYHYISSMVPELGSLHLNLSQHPPHGVLSAAFIDNRVHVTAIFHGLSEHTQSVTLHGPVLSGAKPMTVPLVTVEGTKRISATLDASSAMPYAGSTLFFKHVSVKTESGEEELSGTLEQGMRAVIRSHSGFNGNAVFQFLKDGSFSYSILLAVEPSDRVKSITLNGPARPGSVGPVILELTDYFIQDTTDLTWYANNTIQDKLSSELLLHLWQGHLYINVKLEGDKENSRLISGQISRPGSWYCDRKHQTFCPHMNLYLNGQKPDPGLQTVPTSAEAVFYVDRANALQYSIQVKFSNPQEVALSASVTKGLKNPLTISKFKSNSLDNQHIHEVSGHLPQISPDMEELLREGKLKLVISTSVNPNGDIVGDIPKVERPHCITKSRFSVLWDLQSTPLNGLNVVVGDVVLFTYGQNETVCQLGNRNQYRTCDFSEARLVAAPLHHKMLRGQVQLDMKKIGEFYYASEQNCNNSLYMTITVTESDARPFSDCLKSSYQVWLDQKLSGRGGSAAVGAIIGGSFLAVVSLIMIVLIDRKRKFRSKSSSGFQRF